VSLTAIVPAPKSARPPRRSRRSTAVYVTAIGQPFEPVAPLIGAGVDFSSTRKSGLIISIAEEAERLVSHIVARR
jgi:hypothetical protein